MEVIALGAEAVLLRKNNTLVKKRVKKSYRVRELDIELRKRRTRREVKLLSDARRVGVKVPKVYEVKDYEIHMEFIEGKKLKDVLNKKNWKIYAKRISEIISKLHSVGIIHGDLTTSNMLVKNDELYLIDFGLGFFSERIEDKATDLYLLKQALFSTHVEIAEKMWTEILRYYPDRQVKNHLKVIEKRGRYKLRESK